MDKHRVEHLDEAALRVKHLDEALPRAERLDEALLLVERREEHHVLRRDDEADGRAPCRAPGRSLAAS